MQGIKNIIFDLGGVLINLDMKRTEEAFLSMGARDLHKYFGHGFAASFMSDYEVGKIDDRQFIDALKKMTGLRGSDEEVIKAWNALLLDFPADRIALLRSLKSKFRLFLFSNTNALHLRAFQRIYQDAFGKNGAGARLDDLFEKTYYSHVLGMRKPDKHAFEHILTENALSGSETIFVDDAQVNVEGANEAGIKGFYLKPGMTILDIPWGI